MGKSGKGVKHSRDYLFKKEKKHQCCNKDPVRCHNPMRIFG